MTRISDVLGELSDEDVQWIASAGERREVARDSTVIVEGERPSAPFMILEGELSVFSAAGREIRRLTVGDVAGELSFADAGPASAHLRDIPVIVTSSLDELDSVVRCLEMGAEDYLTKPVNPVLLNARINASLEKKRLRDQQRELISRFATKEVAEELLTSGFSLGGKYVDASAMFCDIRSFTTIAEAQDPAETIELLNDYYTLMMDAINGEGGIVNQMSGDGLMAIFGAPLPREDHRRAAVLAARQMIDLIRLFNEDQAARGMVQIRSVSESPSGRVVAGYAGTHHRATYTCVGDTVNVAARLESHTKVVKRPILIDENTRRGLGDGIAVALHGEVLMKGKTEPINVYAVLVDSLVAESA